MKKIMLSFVLGIFLLSFVVASISGMAVSISGNKLRTFSFNDESYSIGVSKSSDGNADLEINGEKIENVKEGEVFVVDGAEMEVTKVRRSWLFGKRKVDLKVNNIGNVYGLLGKYFAEAGLNKEMLKNYEVKYDSEGNLIYEVINGELQQGSLSEASQKYCLDTSATSCIYGLQGVVTTKCAEDTVGGCYCLNSYGGHELKTDWCGSSPTTGGVA